MNDLLNIIKYICYFYPYKWDLSKARLTKLVYLTDWYHFQRTGSQLTNINWYFDNYGPYVSDIIDIAQRNSNFDIIDTTTMYGTPKTIISYKGPEPSLDNGNEDIANAINNTKNMNWNEFIDFIYNTTPVKNSNRYNYLNME